MTTLQLARRMAMAARHAKSPGEGATAILRVLFDTDSWLRRVSEDANGLTVERDYEPTATQPALFATKGSDVARLVGICQRIEQLATAPHWTADRRWRIAELAAQGIAADGSAAMRQDDRQPSKSAPAMQVRQRTPRSRG